MSSSMVLVGEILDRAGDIVLAAPGDGLGAPAGIPDLVMFAALVGTFMPPLVAVIQQPRWSPITRAIVVIVSCVLVGAGTAALEGQLTGQRWTTAALIVGTAAVTAYRMFWKPAATRIEYATSGEPAPPRPVAGHR
jgi:hypothetical protein